MDKQLTEQDWEVGLQEPPIEEERYELQARPKYAFSVERRDFLKVVGGGLVVLLVYPRAEAQRQGRGRGGGNAGQPEEIAAWLRVAEDGKVTCHTGKTEVGQNIRTSLTQAVAEELHAPVADISFIMADTDLVPYDRGTFGSQSTPRMNLQLRRVAAAAREALLDLAAEHLQQDRAVLHAGDGKVSTKDGTASVSFGELTAGKQLVATVTRDTELRPASEWTVAGTSVPKVNAADLVSGRHKYASDIIRPGMLHGKVLRPPGLNATLKSVDTSAAEAMPGVTVVRDADFVGVVAPDVHLAAQAVAAIKAEWNTTPQVSSAELFDHLKETAQAGGGGRGTRGRGQTGRGAGRGGAEEAFDISRALADSDQTLDAKYTIAYIAHAPLEPRVAVAEWDDADKLTVWTGTQRPFGIQGDLAQTFGIPPEKVRVIVPDTGSGYGGKHTNAAAAEAARLAVAAGKPVKLLWTRQEEFQWAYARPAGVIEIKSGVSNTGKITAWEFHNYNSGGSSIATPYDVPGAVTQSHRTDSPLPQGSYRGLAATANHFARESHMDDLAELVGMDPLEFRLKNLSHERMREVLKATAELFGWGKTQPSTNHGHGIAVGTEKGSYIGTAAEVSVDPDSGEVKLVRIAAAFDCGAVVNPNHLKSQIEGCIVQGIGGALFEALEFANGAVENPYFSMYRMPRFADIPPIEITLVNRTDLPSAGAGETPIVGIAPAIGNAIRAATGKRIRSMPMAPGGKIAL